MPRWLAYLVVALLLAAVGRADDSFLYSSKFLCSVAGESPLPSAPGELTSEFSFHNVHDQSARLLVWALDARPLEVEPLVVRGGEAIEIILDPYDALRFDCDTIDELLSTGRFIGRSKLPVRNGFLRIESDRDVEAVAIHVYTLGDAAQQIELRNLNPRRIKTSAANRQAE